MGYDLGHFDNDFVDTLVEMMCYQVSGPFQNSNSLSGPLTICPYFYFSDLKQMVRNIKKLLTTKLYISMRPFQQYKAIQKCR
jgi:hypothetical protein